jgi:putative spermidine/putrescine transport system permease protein
MSELFAFPKIVDRLAAQRKYFPLIFTLSFLAIFFVYPVAQLLKLSFIDKSGALTVEHYLRLTSSPVYINLLWVTCKIALFTTLLCLVAGYPVAYLLASLSPRSRGYMVVWILVPFWSSVLVRTFAWLILLGRNGAINQTMRKLGLTEVPFDFLYNFGSVLVGMVHALMPLAILTILSVMTNIDGRLTKAAETLGANSSNAFWRIYFPLSMSGVSSGAILVFISSLGYFVTPALLGGRQQQMIAQEIIFQIDEQLNWGFASALSILIFITTFLLFWLYDRTVGAAALMNGAEARSSRAGPKAIGRFGRKFLAGLGNFFGAIEQFVCSRRRPGKRIARRGIVLPLFAGVVILFAAVPAFLVIPVSFSDASVIRWPPSGFTLRWYEEYFSSPIWQAATIRSIIVGILTGIMSMVVGVPAALVLSRYKVPARTLIISILLAPLVLPQIVTALALYYMYSKIGWLNTTGGLIVGHTVLAAPFVTMTVIAVLKNYNISLDNAAITLGAGRVAILWRITFPIIKAGLASAFVLAFVKSFDELTIALFVTDELTATLPKKIWTDAIWQITPTLLAASSVVLVFMTVIILAIEYLRQRSVTSRS